HLDELSGIVRDSRCRRPTPRTATGTTDSGRCRVPEASATRPPSEFDEAMPEFSGDCAEVEYLLAGTADSYREQLTSRSSNQPRL
ncbi:hypothetical protein, partial [Mycobacterium sp.]|uniref:hypothetical protein n=1 Tax=Mycobacterium sp. TaxID=1785 RepID=UPI003C7108F4